MSKIDKLLKLLDEGKKLVITIDKKTLKNLESDDNNDWDSGLIGVGAGADYGFLKYKGSKTVNDKEELTYKFGPKTTDKFIEKEIKRIKKYYPIKNLSYKIIK